MCVLSVSVVFAGGDGGGMCQAKNGVYAHRPQFHILAPLEPGTGGTAWPMALNDNNAVFQRQGVWHVMHQCDGAARGRAGPCGGGHEGPLPSPVIGEQTYWHSWGHVVSADGARWRRVPDVLTPTVTGLDHDRGGGGDGAVSFLEGVGPVLLYSAGAGYDYPRGLPLVTGVARPANASDPEMVRWDKQPPLTFAPGSPPCALPGRVWRSADETHYSMVCVTVGRPGDGYSNTIPDARYQTADSTLQGPWTLVDPRWACPGPKTNQYGGCIRGESGPTTFWPLPSPAGPHEPTHILSDAGGGSFSVGVLDPATERFVPTRAVGTNGSFSTAGGVLFSAAGHAEDGRVLFAGWVPAGAPPAGGWPPECIPPPNSTRSWLGRDCGIQLISAPRVLTWSAELQWLVANPIAELLSLRNRTLLPTRPLRLRPAEPAPLALPAGTGAAMDLTVTFALPAAPAHRVLRFGVRVLGSAGPQLNITVVESADPSPLKGVRWTGRADGPAGNGPGAASPFPILRTETSLQVRVLVDRSVAEFFVAGGRAARAMRWYPAVGDSGAAITAWQAGATAVVEAHEMGCGWA